ncbi:MAG: hypothetical protein ACK5SQ_13155 [Chitinophagales bacterium]|jgi:hypothetical protein
MIAILEILKYILPALVVFATVYYLVDAHFKQQLRVLNQQQKLEAQKLTLPLKLQAYERLILLFERLALDQLLLRVRGAGMTVGELQGALLIAISQEFDHNVSQQLYVSETLWQMVSFTKSELLSLVSKAGEGLDPAGSDEQLVHRLLLVQEQLGTANPMLKTQMAIRTEAGKLF